MSLSESLLRDTLDRAGNSVTPSPELLEHITVAIAHAERRRRAIAALVVCATFLATIAVLYLLVTIRH